MRRNPKYLSLALASLLMVMASARAMAQSPITFQYFYDDLNQLIKVIDSTGATIQYVYDAVGNIQQIIRSSAAPGLTILNVTPQRAPVGATVTIQGQGFSTTPSANIVTFNGVSATVLSATTTTLLVVVPSGATTGPVVVKVGGGTTTFANNFQVLPLPTITSVSPKAVLAGTSVTLTVTGTNLAGATFSLAMTKAPIPKISSPSVNANGTSATLSITIDASSSTYCTVIATNTFGSSSLTPVVGFLSSAGSFNTLSIPGSSPSADPDNDFLTNAQEITLGTDPLNFDTDGDGYPDGLEVFLGSDPLDPASVPSSTRLSSGSEIEGYAFSALNSAIPIVSVQPILREVDSLTISILNNAVPAILTQPTAQEFDGFVFSVLNSNAVPLTLGANLRGTNNGAPDGESKASASSDAAAAAPPAVRITSPQNGVTIVEGQTLAVVADVQHNDAISEVVISVNGVPFAKGSHVPYTLTFTVPAGVTNVSFSATAKDSAGKESQSSPVTVNVRPDVGTSVTGRVVNAQGAPVAGAEVHLVVNAFQGEFFDFQQPLTTLPDLTGRSPNLTSLVSAVNLRNPRDLFSHDPFGLEMSPDYAARFSGSFLATQAGTYRFFLGADEGARLKVNSGTVVDIPTGRGEFVEASGTVELPSGLVPIEVTYYESVGTAELQISFEAPDGERQVVMPSLLGSKMNVLNATTDAAGRFSLSNIPARLEKFAVQAFALSDGTLISGFSQPMEPAPGVAIDAGDIIAAQAPQMKATYQRNPISELLASNREVVLRKKLPGSVLSQNNGGFDASANGHAETWQFTVPPSIGVDLERGFFRVSFVTRDQRPLALGQDDIRVWINGQAVMSDMATRQGDGLEVYFMNLVNQSDPRTFTVTLLSPTAPAGRDWIGIDSVELHLSKNQAGAGSK